MTTDEAKRFSKTLKGLFPNSTDEQMSLIAVRIRGYNYGRSLAVLKTHASSHAYLNVPALMEGLRADFSRTQERRKEESSRRTIDWIRDGILSREGRSDDYLRMTDVEMINRHYDGCVRAVEEGGAATVGKEFALAKIKADRELAIEQLSPEIQPTHDPARSMPDFGSGIL